MSNPSQHLSRQVGIIDTLVFSDNLSHSKFFYKGYTTERNKHKEWKKLAPENTQVSQASNSMTRFVLPLHEDKLGPVSLCWTQGALTTTGGTYRRFSDYLGLKAIERIVLRYGPNTVYTHWPEKKYYTLNKHLCQEKKDIELYQLAGDLSATQRNTLAASSQYICYDIPFPFTLSPDRYAEMRQLAISPYIEVYWKPLESFVQTDGTVPVSPVSDCHLQMYTIHLEPAERDANTQLIESDHGLVRLMEESHVETTTSSYKIPTGTTGEWTHELKNFKSSTRFFAFMLRPTANLETSLANNKTYEVSELYGTIRRFKITHSSSEDVFPWVEPAAFNLYRMHKMFYHGPSGAYIFFYSWDDNPMDELNAHGSYNFQALANPTLVIDFGSTATPSDLHITLLRSEWNMDQKVRGDWSSQFS